MQCENLITISKIREFKEEPWKGKIGIELRLLKTVDIWRIRRIVGMENNEQNKMD